MTTGYWANGNTWYKGLMINGRKSGPWEIHNTKGTLTRKGSYENDDPIGYWETYDEEKQSIDKQLYYI